MGSKIVLVTDSAGFFGSRLCDRLLPVDSKGRRAENE